MKHSRAVFVALLAGGIASTTARGQAVTLSFDDISPCAATPISSYQGWISLTTGVTCMGTPAYWQMAGSPPNYLSGYYSMGWSYLGAPVTFDSFFASGFGTFTLELLNGGSTVYSSTYSVFGTPHTVAPQYGGLIDQVRLRIYYGSTTFGVDDIAFTPLVPQLSPGGGSTSGDSPNGDDPNSNPVSDPSGNDPPGGNGSGPGGEDTSGTTDATVTPEPGSLLLLASGLGGLGAVVRRRRTRG